MYKRHKYALFPMLEKKTWSITDNSYQAMRCRFNMSSSFINNWVTPQSEIFTYNAQRNNIMIAKNNKSNTSNARKNKYWKKRQEKQGK